MHIFELFGIMENYRISKWERFFSLVGVCGCFISIFCSTMDSFSLIRNSTFLYSKHYEVIPLENLFLQYSFGNP
jgi:hypothetical protein